MKSEGDACRNVSMMRGQTVMYMYGCVCVFFVVDDVSLLLFLIFCFYIYLLLSFLYVLVK